ncbi:MAG: GHMP kinase [Desulfurococcales archaeon]|jgi:beta-ribofuranosylaminobenzene 5'-phosphate synthase|nr:GHMP kinase [Desulfurococcales archaeon]
MILIIDEEVSEKTSRKIMIKTGSRLHFGVINPFNKNMRLYVSAGVYVDKPSNFVVISESSEKLVVRGCRSEEVLEKIRALEESLGERLYGEIEIRECVPRHVGLGSTTQLLLAVARGLIELNNVRKDLLEIAWRLGLGRISGVGTHLFIHGGFVIDAGKKDPYETKIPGLMFRTDFPDEWIFIIVMPRGEGLDETAENKVFSSEYKVDEKLVWRASHLLFTEMTPSLLERDFIRFSEALYELQKTVGEMFSVFQGGIYTRYSSEAVEILRREGVIGVGQSSWGPTIYGLIESYDKAVKIMRRIEDKIDAKILLAKPLNRGAEMTPPRP